MLICKFARIVGDPEIDTNKRCALANVVCEGMYKDKNKCPLWHSGEVFKNED